MTSDIEWAYGLRTITAGRSSWGCFTWPPFSGAPVRVEAWRWDPTPVRGHGIHVLHQGRGDRWLLPRSRQRTEIYQVVRYKPDLVVHLRDHAKVPWVDIVYEGGRASAVDRLIQLQGSSVGVVHATLTGGDEATLIAGPAATLTAAGWSTLIAEEEATVVAGYGATIVTGANSRITAGDHSRVVAGGGSTITVGTDCMLTAGILSTITAGTRSVISIKGFLRPSCAVVVSEDGPIKPGHTYKVSEPGEWVEEAQP